MCGITGAIEFNQRFHQAQLEKSLELLHHRGPDESGTFISSKHPVAFGHARLSIIDLAHGKQPLKNPAGNLHLVTNGEIYNYKELSEQYSQVSASALTHSDSEAILQCYQANGIEGFKNLYGMFAFALYDEQQNITFLGRDRLGIKPLYFTETVDGIFFASEIKALFPYLSHQPEIAPSALTQFLQHQFNTGRDTIFKSIKRVLPGEILEIQQREIRHHQYWDVSQTPRQTIGLNDALQNFDPLFNRVMQQHMRADVPFGLFLSGGVDSSILLAKLCELHDHPLKTYSIGFQDVQMEDELSAADELAKHFGTDHQSIRVNRDQLFERIVHSIWLGDDLMRDYASLPTHLLSEVASQDVKIVFSGEGGDEAFAGYRRYAPHMGRTLLHTLLRQPIRVRDQWKNDASALAFGPELQTSDTRSAFIQSWKQCPTHWSIMQKRQSVDIRHALADNLFVKTDRMMMGFGLEGRVPFSDHRLIEFGLSLPDDVKYPKNRGKWLLREWAKQHLPHAHLQKPKRGFYVPVNEWLRGDFLQVLCDKLPNNPGIKVWFNPEGVKKLLHKQVSSGRYTREVWGLMQFAIWHHMFIDTPLKPPSISENPLDWI